MLREIAESDWKIFRELHRIALARFCERVLTEVAQCNSDMSKGAHERYLAVFELIQRRDDELAEAFNDFRRSTAKRQIAAIHSRGLLTEEEFARFSPETRAAVQAFLGR
jgi:hypothetical protein